ncbi:ankyrin repeat domain-containing protein [Pelagibius sp.]|uniref:ankyrin repeat domain-containing protein n=1 Tax=Pelagibius sp. TaxID=1931238 RepID=UPI002622F808|nr:ankyrin repeat domain-containing protein [Pelagibius sp.]
MLRSLVLAFGLSAAALSLASCKSAQVANCTTLCRAQFWEDATLQTVKAELENGASAVASNDFGETPLHDAVYHTDSLSIVEYLLDHGANPNAQNILGATPVFTAATSNPNPAVLRLLIDRGGEVQRPIKGNIRPIHLAAKANENPQIISVLAEAGANLESRVENGWTPLFFAVTESSNPEVAKRLLDLGASLTAQDDEYGTPLHAAAGGTLAPEMVALLIQYGADVHAADDLGSTPMHWVYLRGVVDEVMREHGYDIGSDEETDEERRLNMEAAKSIIPMLKAAGAKINARNDNGETPLHWAVTFSANSQLIEAMLDNGADPTIRDGEGRNAAELLIQHWPNFRSSNVYQRMSDAAAGG